MSKLSVSVIGAGRLGGALALALADRGYRIENLFARNRQTAESIIDRFKSKPSIQSLADCDRISSQIIIIAVQDAEIERVAKLLVQRTQKGTFIFHTSGSLSSKILAPLAKVGCRTGSIHPLVSISDAALGARRFAGAYFCVEGEREVVKTAEKIVGDLGGQSFRIAERYKTLYHAAAVTAAGHFVALIDAAVEMLAACGLDEKEAQKILLPLVRSTLENLAAQNPARALTGTFARADVETFARHVAALEENVSAEAREIYLELGLRSLQLAAGQGADAKNIGRIREQILLAKNKSK